MRTFRSGRLGWHPFLYARIDPAQRATQPVRKLLPAEQFARGRRRPRAHVFRCARAAAADIEELIEVRLADSHPPRPDANRWNGSLLDPLSGLLGYAESAHGRVCSPLVRGVGSSDNPSALTKPRACPRPLDLDQNGSHPDSLVWSVRMVGSKMSSMEQDPQAVSQLEALAQRTEERAARARQSAALARDEARRNAEQRDHEAERLHLREAEAHEQAARVTEKTAALYRSRIRYLRSREP